MTVVLRLKCHNTSYEYDNPMQEAYISGCWDDMAKLMRGFFNVTFKDNTYTESAALTGIRRVGRESMFSKMVRGWFKGRCSGDYGEFIKALLRDDIEEMNIYMNRVALQTIICFDSANNLSNESEPEKFHHGFVLGLLVALRDRYPILSNRERVSYYGFAFQPEIPANYTNDSYNMHKYGIFKFWWYFPLVYLYQVEKSRSQYLCGSYKPWYKNTGAQVSGEKGIDREWPYNFAWMIWKRKT